MNIVRMLEEIVFSTSNSNETQKNFTLQSQQHKLPHELDMSDNALAYASLYTIY